MASAEHLLHEAQYAFASISFGESRDNLRHRARAKSLCKKIIRRYPATMQAGEAHAILRRLGEEAFTSNIRARHRHIKQAEHHRKPRRVNRTTRSAGTAASTRLAETRTFVTQDASEDASLNWSGLLSLLLAAPKVILGILALFGFILFGILGPFLFAPFVIAFLVLGPFKSILSQPQRANVNSFIVAVNKWIDEDGKTGNWIGRS